MHEIKKRLSKFWTIDDKGPVKWMLNVRIKRDRPAGIMKIDQSAYIERKLREFGLDKLPPKVLPMKPGLRLSKSMCPTTVEGKQEVAKFKYRSHTGALNYLRITRPDLCCTNSILSLTIQQRMGSTSLRCNHVGMAIRRRNQVSRTRSTQKWMDPRTACERLSMGRCWTRFMSGHQTQSRRFLCLPQRRYRRLRMQTPNRRTCAIDLRRRIPSRH